MGSKTTTTEAKMPQFQEDFIKGTIIPRAEAIASQEFEPFTGERVAGMTGLQEQALQGYGALSTPSPESQQAAQAYGQLSQFQPQAMQAATAAPLSTFGGVGAVQGAMAPGQMAVDTAASRMSQYQNPYEDAVVQAALRDVEQGRQAAINREGAAATSAGAFGGSRQAIRQAELDKAANQQALDTAARLRSQGFTQALGASQFDIGQTQAARSLAAQQAMTAATLGQQARESAAARAQAAGMAGMTAANQAAQAQAAREQAAAQANLSAALSAGQLQATGAAGLAGLGSSNLRDQMAALSAQMGAGETQRMLGQQGLDAAYQEYLARQNYPLTQFGVLTGAASAIPTGYGTTIATTRDPMGTLGMGLQAFGGLGMGGIGPLSFGSGVTQNPFLGMGG